MLTEDKYAVERVDECEDEWAIDNDPTEGKEDDKDDEQEADAIAAEAESSKGHEAPVAPETDALYFAKIADSRLDVFVRLAVPCFQR